MKLLATFLFACCCLTTKSQSLDDLTDKFINLLNENRGMGVFAYNSNMETLFEYSSHIWYAWALDGKTLTVDDNRRLISSDGRVREKLWGYRILCVDIKSFELKSSKNYPDPGGDGESVMSTMLVIKCTLKGEHKEIEIGLHPKANAKTVQELNGLLLEIKKRL